MSFLSLFWNLCFCFGGRFVLCISLWFHRRHEQQKRRHSFLFLSLILWLFSSLPVSSLPTSCPSPSPIKYGHISTNPSQYQFWPLIRSYVARLTGGVKIWQTFWCFFIINKMQVNVMCSCQIFVFFLSEGSAKSQEVKKDVFICAFLLLHPSGQHVLILKSNQDLKQLGGCFWILLISFVVRESDKTKTSSCASAAVYLVCCKKVGECRVVIKAGDVPALTSPPPSPPPPPSLASCCCDSCQDPRTNSQTNRLHVKASNPSFLPPSPYWIVLPVKTGFLSASYAELIGRSLCF